MKIERAATDVDVKGIWGFGQGTYRVSSDRPNPVLSIGGHGSPPPLGGLGADEIHLQIRRQPGLNVSRGVHRRNRIGKDIDELGES